MIVGFCFWSSLSGLVASVSATKFVQQAENFIFYTGLIKKTTSQSEFVCALQCGKIPECISFTYHEWFIECTLYSNTQSRTQRLTQLNTKLYVEQVKFEEYCSRFGFTYNDNTDSCLKIYNVKLNFSMAVAICGENSASLVKIDSQQKNDYVKTFLTDNGISSGYFQIQGHRMQNPDDWAFDDNMLMTYFNWNDWQPEDQAGEDNLMMQFTSGRWHDVHDSEKNSFVCEILV